jgi:molecular chaperone DnaK
VAEVKEALKGGDPSAIRTASEKLNEAWQAVSAELYKAASEKAHAGAQSHAGGAESSGTGSGSKKDEGPIIDAEVVDDKK